MRNSNRLITVSVLAVASIVAASCASEPAGSTSGYVTYDRPSADEFRIDTGTNVQGIWQRATHNLDGR